VCVNKLARLFIDETQPTFIKRTHPRKGEKKKQRDLDQNPGKRTAKKKGRPQERKGNHSIPKPPLVA
jgi:hypothetical protein